ncbi:hypothetical protein TrRE_jg3769 [Triparma retinervis]|uniref:PDZ domain-containing protein n=1 Tax=Triparma retinervis TaxID=2557542 RepID=A0A9W7DXK0_9STRA|nr:hypothetical protein TrRE_jg3769 [Triparma retinervis]
MSDFASFDAFGNNQSDDFDPFGSQPPTQTSQRQPQSQQSQPNAFSDFTNMGQALPSQTPQQQQQQGQHAVPTQSEGFADFFNSGPAKPLNTQQQQQQGQPDLFGSGSFDHKTAAPAPSPAPVAVPAFSHQTSSEFDDIFGGSAAPPARQAPAAPAAPAAASTASFDAFSSDPNPPLPRQDRRDTNTSFEDFFNSPTQQQQPSIVESKRFSVGGTFHAQDLNLSPVSDDEDDYDDEGSDDGVMEAPDPSMFHAPPTRSPPGGGGGGGRKYSVRFETEKKLGMLLERHDEWIQPPGGVGKLKECTVVKLIVEHGAADVKGVSLGSRVVAVNEHDCLHRPYLETLNLVKTTARPMTIVMQEGKLADDECISGYCLLRKSVGPIPPSSFATWKRRYFVLGGAVANKNVLQVYKSKRDYEHVVVSLFERKPIHVKLKAYKLSPGFSISALKSVRYSEVGANVFYFTLMTPQAKFKMIKFGSDNADQMRDLHQNVTRFTGVESSTW